MLASMRTLYDLHLPKIRRAVAHLTKTSGFAHPLIEQPLFTNRVDVLVASKKSRSRQFAGKPEQLQLDDFILYLDENLDNCQPIIEALIANAVQYRRHRENFCSWDSR